MGSLVGDPSQPWLDSTSKNRHIPSNGRFTDSQNRDTGTLNQVAIFLDRDGVLVEDIDYLGSPSQIKMLPGVAQAIQSLRNRFLLVVVTNQSGVARGRFTEENLLAVHTELVTRLWNEGAALDVLYYCPHLPGAEIAEYREKCECRKPGAGMLLKAATDWGIDLKHSFIVGDRASDMEAGRAVGVTGILVGGRDGEVDSLVKNAKDLAEATEHILAQLPPVPTGHNENQESGRRTV